MGKLEKKKKTYQDLLEGFKPLDGHKLPVTRRDFLSSGLIAGSGYITLPTIATMLLKSGIAEADACGATGANPFIPVITINGAGGMGIAHNFLPLTSTNQPLTSYSQLSGGFSSPTTAANMSKFMGVNVRQDTTVNGLVNGIMSAASASTLANTQAITACASANDDNSGDPMSLSGLLSAAGAAKAAKITTPTGNQGGTGTGVASGAAVMAAPSILQVNDLSSLLNALAPTGTLATALNPAQRLSIANLINQLSAEQAQALVSKNNGAAASQLITCATGSNVPLIQNGVANVDPRTNTALQTIWGINTGSSTNTSAVVQAGIVLNTIVGNTGPGGIVVGGCDYHDGTATSGAAVNQQIGILIGRVLQTAAVLNSPVFIHFYTDGGIASDTGGNFVGDRGNSGLQVGIAYKPSGAPALATANMYQLGAFDPAGQNALNSNFTGADGGGQNAAIGIFMNYLHLCGQDALATSVLGTNAPPSGTNLVLFA